MTEKKDKTELQQVWSAISHDLITPLMVIRSNLKFIHEKSMPALIEVYKKAKKAGIEVPEISEKKLEQYSNLPTVALDSVDYLRQMVSCWNHKILMERMFDNNTTLEISHCINEATKNYKAKYDLDNKSRININLQEANVHGNKKIIEHVLYELLVNAEYAARCVTIGENDTIVFINSKVEDDIYRLHVRNIGPSIEADECDKIFAPYYTTKTSHVGLGLTLCEQAMKAMGGNITCNPNKDGLEFILEFKRMT